jgi:hypothetical protein
MTQNNENNIIQMVGVLESASNQDSGSVLRLLAFIDAMDVAVAKRYGQSS